MNSLTKIKMNKKYQNIYLVKTLKIKIHKLMTINQFIINLINHDLKVLQAKI